MRVWFGMLIEILEKIEKLLGVCRRVELIECDDLF